MSQPRRPANAETVRRFVPAASLNRETFSELMRSAVVSSHTRGETIVTRGTELEDRLYVVSGVLEVTEGDAAPRTVAAGSEAAKHPVVAERHGDVGVRAVEPSEVLHLNAAKLDMLITWDQLSGIHVEEIAGSTLGTSTGIPDDVDWVTRLLSSGTFQKVPPTNIQKLFMAFEELSVDANAVVVGQGDDGDYYYVIRTGTFAVTRASSSGREVELARLGPGDGFGEEALLAEQKRNATVRSMVPATLMRLSRDNFRELLQAPLVHRVDIDTAREMVRGGAQLVDVRMEPEHKIGSIKGSLNVPLFMLRLKLASFDRERSYVCYCDTGRRSQAAAFLLSEAGYDAWLLEGGLAALASSSEAAAGGGD